MFLRAVLIFAFLCANSVFAQEEGNESEAETTRASGIAPDLREDETKFKLQKRDFIIVPVPIVTPTIGSGLVVGGAYFYQQTEEQKKVQPASMTAAGGVYTNNDSKAFVVGHQSYWAEDTWRLGGGVGRADLKLLLQTPDDPSTDPTVNWNVRGSMGLFRLDRKVFGDWYAGVFGRVVDFEQSISALDSVNPFDESEETKTVGLGLRAEHDSRDMPLNSYTGHLFHFSALFNNESLGSDSTYQTVKLEYRSYHELQAPVVLAWELRGCEGSLKAPLWDACKIGLRGFSATTYLGKASASAQFEARWRMSKRWGVVGFAGAGYIVESFSESRERELIPSYGIGVRFMVLQSKRINLRIDYARSTDSDAFHMSVGEAF
jgi:hypothetical protein